jgi:NAD(P)-dependent dehydrogenase (short-subunit alcohol dehydrogenase family)
LVFCLTRAAWPHLKARRGVIVNTASLTGLMSFKSQVTGIDVIVDGGMKVW